MKEYIEITPLEAAQLQSEGWTAFAFRENDDDEWMTDDLDFIDFRMENREEAFFAGVGEWYEHCAKVVEVSPVATGHNPAKLTEEQKKTIREWLETLPDGYRELALKNLNSIHADKQCSNLGNALQGGFTWGETLEKSDFWVDVSLWASGEGELPQLPEPEKTPEQKLYESILERAKSGKPMWFTRQDWEDHQQVVGFWPTCIATSGVSYSCKTIIECSTKGHAFTWIDGTPLVEEGGSDE